MEAACLLEYCRLFEVGIWGVVITPGTTLILKFEFVKCSLNLREEVVHREAVSLCHYFIYFFIMRLN
jgi:hypothetical protein